MASVEDTSCACAAVLKATARRAPASIEALWEQQEIASASVARAWEKSVGGAVSQIGRGNPSSMRDVERLLVVPQAAARGFSKGTLTKTIETIIETSYSLGRVTIRKRDKQLRANGKLPAPAPLRAPVAKASLEEVLVGFNLSLQDERAIESLTKQALLWFRDTTGLGYDDAAAREAIETYAREQLEKGVAGRELADGLMKRAEALYGVGKFATKGADYWGGVVENASTNAGVLGSLTELVDLGWTRYEIVNPMDERTTPICQMLNGKVLYVDHAMELYKQLAAASSIDEVKETKPFASGGRATPVTKAVPSLKVGSQVLSKANSSALAEAGFAMPPYHFRCRSFVDIYVSEGSI